MVLLDIGRDQRLRQHETVAAPFAFQFHYAVVGGLVYGQACVAGQGPWGRRPSQQKHVSVCRAQLLYHFGAAGRRRSVHLEFDEYRWVRRDFPVAPGHFVGAEAGYAPGTVWSAPHGLVEQVLVPERLQHPPTGLDIVIVQGDVGVFHVDPVADAVGHGLPLFDIAEDALPALLVELFDTVFFDIPFAFEAQLFLDLQLHGQPVGVPAALALHPEPLHGAVAADDIFEDAGEDVVDAGAAVGGGRTLVHHEQGSVGTLGLGAAEDVLILPLFQDVGVQFRETDTAGNGLKHRGNRSLKPASMCRLSY